MVTKGVELSFGGVQFTPTCGGAGHLLQRMGCTGVELSLGGVQFTPTCGGAGHLGHRRRREGPGGKERKQEAGLFARRWGEADPQGGEGTGEIGRRIKKE